MPFTDLEKYTLKLDSWHTPATDHPEEQQGDYRIHHSRYTRGTYEMWGIDNYIFFEVTKPIPITTLQQLKGKKWRNWMVDDPPHWRAMQIYAEQSKGTVLVGGLGLGLVVGELVKNPSVDKIIVVERSVDVFALVESHLPDTDKLKIVLGDFYGYAYSGLVGPVDTIIVDLWMVRGIKEKMDVYFREAIPTTCSLRSRYPEASITLHGFHTLSDIQHTSEEMKAMIYRMNG